MTDWTSLNFVVVDVEGNGRQPPDLVELAAVPIVGGVIGEPLSWLVKPDAPIKHFATRIHGLTNKDVADCPSFDAISGNVLAALDADALVAHNAHVDLGVLSRKLPDWESPEVFDTLKLARRLVPGLDSYRLGSLVEAYSLAEGCPTASARTGRRMTRSLPPSCSCCSPPRPRAWKTCVANLPRRSMKMLFSSGRRIGFGLRPAHRPRSTSARRCTPTPRAWSSPPRAVSLAKARTSGHPVGGRSTCGSASR